MVNIWKIKGGKAWIIVSAVFMVLMITIYILTTQVSLIYGTLKLILGEERLNMSAAVTPTPVFTSDYATKDDSAKAAYKLSEEICEDGIVLLKNENKSLPLDEKSKISVFGKNSVNMVYGGTGSGGRSTDAVVNLYQALAAEDFEINPTLKAFYDDNSASGNPRPSSPSMGTILTGFPIAETPKENYSAEIVESYGSYNDAAIIVLARMGGEGFDLPRTMFYDGKSDSKYNNFNSVKLTIPGAFAADSHYLQIDRNETDLIKHVCDNFNNVVIVLNTGTSMELGFLDRPDFWANLDGNGEGKDYSSKINAALWIGNPGGSGNTSLARILKGEVNPSGRTVDTFVRDFRQDPTWYNFGNNLTDRGNEYFIGAWGAKAVTSKAFFERYEEGVYMGYRYWETRSKNELPNWYKNNVTYSFGHGLSYTDFSWTLIEQKYTDGTELNANDRLKEDGILSYKIRVTNEGKVAGKDVVQLYYSAPYYSEGIEKSSVVLGDFAKTDIIEPGEFDDVELTIKVSDMASYDWNDKNGNNFTGYEVEPGSYTIRFAKNAHDYILNYNYLVEVTKTVNGDKYVGFTYNTDSATGKPVSNKFDNVSKHIEKTGGYMTRASFATTKPGKFPKDRGLNVFPAGVQETTDFFAPFNFTKVTASYDEGKPWYKDTMPKTGAKNNLVLSDMIGVNYDDNEKWNKLLDQLTISEMNELIGVGAFSTKQVTSIKKPLTKEFDGPGGFVVGSFMSTVKDTTVVTFFPCESLIGATWNKGLAKRMGEAVGDEGIWGASFDGVKYTMSGWYAPAMNLHRSQFSGRNFEYYSEDPVLSGFMAAEVVIGAQSKGTYCYLKHFVLNDQETNRSDNGIATWADEQTMRELYFKPFEISIKKSMASVGAGRQPITGVMTSFNRIGSEWTGASYALLTGILRNEWGFKGTVITDFSNGKGTYMDLDMMIRAGGDLNLFQSSWLSTSGSSLTATQVSAMRQASKNILYTVANSNAMNNPYGPMLLPMWVIWMIIIMAVIFAGICVWGFFVIFPAVKRKRAEKK